jgi:pimeloyl-ACP methyl ester carboxylesterase
MSMTRRLLLGIVSCWLIAPAGLHAQEGSFDSNGVKIHYVVQGQGEPVLLIPGFAVDIQMQWVLPGVIRALAKDYQVIALDNRGHGASGKPHDPKKYGLEMVEDAVRLLDHLKIKKAHVVGYSMGGAIALKLATVHPDRLLSVTLGGMGLLEPSKEPVLRALAASLEKGQGLGPLLVWLTPPGTEKPSEQQVKPISDFLLARNDAQALAAVVRGSLDQGLEIPPEQLKALRVPMLAVIGSADPFKKEVDELKKRVPRLEVVVVENGDHMSTVFNPLFLKALKGFLAKTGQKDRANGASPPRP